MRADAPPPNAVDDVDYNDPALTGYQARLAPWRAAKGVVRLRFGASTGLVLLRYADVRNAFCDDVRFSKSKALRPITFPFMGPNLMGYDGHEHRVKRALVSRAFRRNAIIDDSMIDVSNRDHTIFLDGMVGSYVARA